MLNNIVDFLTDGYWQQQGEERRTFNVQPGGTLTANITALTLEGQQLATCGIVGEIEMTEHSKKLQGDADVIVIGSGFGGSVVASRLVEAGMSVLLLERGPWRDTVPVREAGVMNTRPLPRSGGMEDQYRVRPVQPDRTY